MKSEFTTKPLSALADIQTGPFGSQLHKEDYVQNGTPIVTVEHLGQKRFTEQNLPCVSEIDKERLSKYILREGDVVFSRVGSVDRCSYVSREYNGWMFSGRCLRVRPCIEIDSQYLYYYFTLESTKQFVRGIATGATMPSINTKFMGEVPIAYPPIDEQRKIATVLSALDNKIELNDKINKNLEQQAKAVFKSWFEDFDPFDEPLIETPAGIYAPASLQMVQIANIPHVLETGKRPKGGAVASGVPSIGAENVKQLGVVNFSSAKFIPEEFAEKMKTGAINGYELLLYKDGGKPGTFIPHFSMFGEGFPYQKFFINEHVFKLDFGDKGFNEFAYFFMQTDYAYHWLASNGGKAAVPGINQQNVKDIWIFSPENSKVKEFGEWVQPLFTTILKNCAQNVKLAELRDTLLPKLMSGELDVSDIEL